MIFWTFQSSQIPLPTGRLRLNISPVTKCPTKAEIRTVARSCTSSGKFSFVEQNWVAYSEWGFTNYLYDFSFPSIDLRTKFLEVLPHITYSVIPAVPWSLSISEYCRWWLLRTFTYLTFASSRSCFRYYEMLILYRLCVTLSFSLENQPATCHSSQRV